MLEEHAINFIVIETEPPSRCAPGCKNPFVVLVHLIVHKKETQEHVQNPLLQNQPQNPALTLP